MTDHFRERTKALNKERGIFAEYAKRFYRPEFDWTNLLVSVQASEAEKIVNVIPEEKEIRVITDNFNQMLLRYHLRREGQGWLIWGVDIECPICRQQGRNMNCYLCGGTIWERKKAACDIGQGQPPGQEPPPEDPGSRS